MSVGLDVRLCTDSTLDHDPAARFQALAAAVEATGLTGPWQGLRVADGQYGYYVYDNRDRLDLTGLRRIASGFQGATLNLSTGNTFSCVHESGEPRGVHIRVQAWGSRYRGAPTGDWWLDGDSLVYFNPIWPFYSRPPRPDRPLPAHQAAATVENIIRLRFLIEHIVDLLEPTAVKVYSEGAVAIPFNAHLVYARELTGYLRDLEVLRRAWHEGIPAMAVPALRLGPTDQGIGPVLHEWRSQAEQTRLLAVLDNVLTRAGRPGTPAVERILTSPGRHYQRLESGHLITGSEQMMDAFVDDFYLTLAAAR